MKKWILMVFAAILLTAIGIGLYEWNKGELSVEKTEGIKISSSELYTEFITDSVKAKMKFIDKVVQVDGIINEVSKNQQGQLITQIKTNSDGANINCTSEKPIANIDIKTGDKITVKGVCKGLGEGDNALGILGDVYLTRCYQIK